MSFVIVLAALIFLMFVAYRGYSVIMFAPVAALLAVLFTDPSQVLPMFIGVFMDKMVGFVKLYFPVFMLGAIFGKVIELSGFSKSIVSSVIKFVGQKRAMLSIVLVCVILTYGGVSLFVVVFAVYPFAAEMFRQGGIPKRLIPGTIALGAFTISMDSLPGTPQIQNIIPTTFFGTDTWAAPIFAFRQVSKKFAEGTREAVAGSLLAAMNTAAEYGFGGIIAALPGFIVIADALRLIPNPLVNEAITVTTLAGITGSASGGMSIALAAMSDVFIQAANAAHIPLEVLHRVASMASGGMDTLPHNGAVITLLAVTGLTHKTSYKDIFSITCIKTGAVFVVIAAYYLFGIV